MVGGVGIDLVEITRLERALLRRPRLAERLFTAAEREYAEARERPGRHLAARFAAKEAVIKALGMGEGVVMTEIEVVPGEPPSIRLSGRAAEAAGEATVEVSLTHAREYAAAVAIKSGPG